MAYNRAVFQAVLDAFSQKRGAAQDRLQDRRRALLSAVPRLREIDRQLTGVASRISKDIVSGVGERDVEKKVYELRDHILELKKEQAELLTELDLPIDYLSYVPDCEKCSDMGYIGTKMCDCFQAALRREAYARSNLGAVLSHQTFDGFSLSYYSDEEDPRYRTSPKKNMRAILKFCREYADRFGDSDTSLLMTGAPGLGKTYLSSCIANSLIEQGCGVIYDTAANIFARFEAEKFGKGVREGETTGDYFDCDLLIVDDLGTEFSTAFSLSVFFNLVNTRMLAEKRMIISTNLTLEELRKTYSDKIISRIIGEFRVLTFFGEDIRQLKKLRGKRS